MKSPDTGIGEQQQWQRLQKLLGGLGIDADTVMVGATPLRAMLQRWAAHYTQLKACRPLTTTEFNAKIDAELAFIAAIRAHYQDDTTASLLANRLKLNIDFDKGGSVTTTWTVDTMLEALAPLEDELRTRRKTGRNRNAAKDARDAYWYQLAQIWDHNIVPLAKQRPPRKQLIDFLVICTGGSASAIKNFLDRLPQKMSHITNEILTTSIGMFFSSSN